MRKNCHLVNDLSAGADLGRLGRSPPLKSAKVT